MGEAVSNFFEQLQLRLAAKAGVAAALSLIIGIAFGKLFDRPDTLVSGLWTVLSSIVVVNAYLGGTYLAALIRFLGTLVGAIIAGTAITFMGAGPLALGLGVFATVILCSLLRLNESVRIASITTALIMVLASSQPELSPWLFGLYRFADSTMGIIVAVAVAHTLWPTQATRRVRLNMVVIMEKLRELFLAAARRAPLQEASTQQILALLAETEEHIRTSRIEIRTRSSLDDWNFLLEHLRNLFDSLTIFANVDTALVAPLLDQELANETEAAIRSLDTRMLEIITTSAMRKPLASTVDIAAALAALDTALNTFRQKPKDRRFTLKEAESFFVFFYSLRRIGDELSKLTERLVSLYG